jgi:hypothetical protein
MRFLFIALLFVAAPGLCANDYAFPINNPFLATVVGTPEPLRAELPDKARLKIRRLSRADWEMPEAMWFSERLEYSYRMQRGPAPMIFLIAGTGGFHNTTDSR